jgi:hypothetical protein
LSGRSGSGAGETSIARGEVAVALFVGLVKMGFELGNGVLVWSELSPVFDGIGEDAGFFQILRGGTDCGGFGDGINGMGKDDACPELFPEIFDGLLC